MSMTRFKKHSRIWKGMMLGTLVIATIASPLPLLSIGTTNLLIPSIVHAQPISAPPNTTSPGTSLNSLIGANSLIPGLSAVGAAQNLYNSVTGQQPQTTSCASFLISMASPFTCMFRVLISGIAAALIWVSSQILVIASLLFNWLVDHTIVQFGTTYSDLVKKAVETAWTAFRDIANILIIGIFTFIAISIILGLKEYGQKKMIANVLIIAVLINFSLLATKMIIDASNFTATQIYTAGGLGGSASANISAQDAAGTNNTTSGISAQFLNLLGVGTIGNAYKLVNSTAEAKDSNLAALLRGILIAVVLLGAALVLFYGSFLLVSRMIMLIFLMVTASLAFASYLIPAWAGSSYGWKAWKDSLLWCAAFAPILMFFLWMTLSVSYALKGPPDQQTATLGAALSDPATGGNIAALFNYVMILGLLFATFKISSMAANKIGGFSMAQMVPGIGLGIAGLATGVLGRTFVATPMRAAKNAMREKGWSEQGILKRSAVIAANRLSRKSFDPLKSKPVAAVASTFGIPKVFSGAKMGEGGVEGVIARKAKAADDLARQISATGAAGQTNEHNEAERRRDRRETEHNRRTENENVIATLTANAERDARTGQGDERTNAERELAEAIRDQAHSAETHASDIRVAEQRAGNAQDPDTQRAASENLTRLRAERQEAMAGEAARIETAREATTRLNTGATRIATDALTRNPDAIEANRVLREVAANLARHAEEEQRLGTPKQVAKQVADTALRRSLLWDPRVRDQDIEGEMRTHARRQKALDIQAATDAAAPRSRPAPTAAPGAARPTTPPAAPGGGH